MHRNVAVQQMTPQVIPCVFGLLVKPRPDLHRALRSHMTVAAWDAAQRRIGSDLSALAQPMEAATLQAIQPIGHRLASMVEAIRADARREMLDQYRRALLARAAQARNAQDRRAALARKALNVQGPTLTYLLALNGDADALEALTERAQSDAFAAEVLAAVEAVKESSRALALTVWAVAVSLTYLATVEALAGRWGNPRPSRTPDLLRYSLDRVAPPASASRIADRPAATSATAEEKASSTSTPVQEYRRIET